jgi:hypothetical protein
MIYLSIYLITGLVIFIVCATYEALRYRGDIKDLFSAKKSLKMFILFLAFWPWIVIFYIREEKR